MGKQYKGKLCVYCSERKSETGDHVFAREFFLIEDRAYLPKAPSCTKCNRDKSDLEHYLVSVMPFGGKHSQATQNITMNVPRRLEKNQKLQNELAIGMKDAWLRDGGSLYVPTASMPFDGVKLEGLLKYILRGLAWPHWKEYVGKDWPFRVMFLPDVLSRPIQARMHTLRKESIVTKDLGRGTVQYELAQVGKPAELIFLVVEPYGGVMLSGSRGPLGFPNETSRHWWVIAGQSKFAEAIENRRPARSSIPQV